MSWTEHSDPTTPSFVRLHQLCGAKELRKILYTVKAHALFSQFGQLLGQRVGRCEYAASVQHKAQSAHYHIEVAAAQILEHRSREDEVEAETVKFTQVRRRCTKQMIAMPPNAHRRKPRRAAGDARTCDINPDVFSRLEVGDYESRGGEHCASVVEKAVIGSEANFAKETELCRSAREPFVADRCLIPPIRQSAPVLEFRSSGDCGSRTDSGSVEWCKDTVAEQANHPLRVPSLNPHAYKQECLFNSKLGSILHSAELLLAVVVPLAIAGTVSDARAQALVARPIPVMCGPYDAITAGLGSRYAERRVAWGRMESSVVELWRSPKGTFTIIVRLANGVACLPAVGDDWTDDRGT